MPKISRQEANKYRRAVIEFAQEHGLIINPAKGFEPILEGFLEFGFCPCDPKRERTNCPCHLALQDIEEKGHCLCKMFWNNMDQFKKAYEDNNEETNSRETTESA